MKTRILVSDSFSQEGLDILQATEGFEVVYKTGMKEDELAAFIPGFDGLIIRSATTVTEKVLRAADKLRVVARAGVGTDNVDQKTATELGVVVMNAPGGNSISTAELAMALLFSLARKIPQANASMKQGIWEKKKYIGTQLHGKTMGVIGLGRIGSELVKRCLACGMDVVAYDPFLSAEQVEAMGAKLTEPAGIYQAADFISVHVPLTDKTKNMISTAEIATMKKTTMLINCARGGIMDEAAVAAAVAEGRLGGAAFDVFPEEPPKDSPFVPVENVIMTPHLGASTEEAQVQVAIETAEEIVDFFKKDIIRNSVNVPPMDQKLRLAMAPWIRVAEKMGCFLSNLQSEPITEIVVTYSGEISDKKVYFLTQTVLKGLLDPVMSNKVNFVNAPNVAKERGIKVSERKETVEHDFTSLISVKTTTKSGSHELWGTVYGEKDARFVYLDGYHFDLEPEGTVLVVHNNDVPGVVGAIGTILGDAGINIASMRLGRQAKGSSVLTILGIDGEIPAAVLARIVAHQPIVDAKVVALG